MLKKLSITMLCAVAALFVGVKPARAHHAFGAEFDSSRPVVIRGNIVKIEWVNPHTWIHVENVKADGTKEVWMFEGGSPNTLLRRGLTKDTFPPGTAVVIDGYQARDHTELRANARNVTFPDGRKLFLGSTGTGAPNPEDFPAKPDQAKPDQK
jgi:hypothetical protein